MALQPHTGTAQARYRVPQRTWVGLLAVAILVLIDAGLSAILTAGVSESDAATRFALGHLIPLPIVIVIALVFLRWSRWGSEVWRETPTPRMQPARRWLIAIPVLLVLLPLAQISDVPWAERSIGFVLLVVSGTLLVGIAEELYVRGILLTAVRGRHGELYALLVTSFVFAIAHIPSSIIHGVPIAAVAFQVAVLAATGSTYYWARRVTGRLWPAMLIHALTDCVLYLASGAADASSALTSSESGSTHPFAVPIQLALWVLAFISVFSAAKEDRRNRRQHDHPNQSAEQPTN